MEYCVSDEDVQPINEGTQSNTKKKTTKKSFKKTVLSKEQYAAWKAHRDLILNVKARVDIAAPKLIPELYMKSRILEKQTAGYQKRLLENFNLLMKINKINRFGGWVDCRLLPSNYRSKEKLLKARRILAEELILQNEHFYCRLSSQQAVACRCKELNIEWKHTLDKIRLMGKFPFCLESVKPIDKGMVDPNFHEISGKRKYWMEFDADGGIHLGRIIIELFEKVCPQTCSIFKKIVKGTAAGMAYAGTKVFMIVPDMYCSVGDVTKDNGFGGIVLDEDLAVPENFTLNHSIPGVLSMDIYDKQVNGIFNIIFKPMPFLDGRAVVFGRIVGGNSSILECLCGMGTPLGMTRGNPFVSGCGWINKRQKYCRGALNTALLTQ